MDEHDKNRSAEDDALVSEVGHLSLNEEREVRFHGQASGLHLLDVKERIDGRNEGGIWSVAGLHIHCWNDADYIVSGVFLKPVFGHLCRGLSIALNRQMRENLQPFQIPQHRRSC